MNFLKNNKKPGFTLMEVALAVLIIAVLILTLAPVIKGQLKKSEEYSYYLAFKTVEKLGGQIVALGDPELTHLDNSTRIANNPLRSNSFDRNTKLAQRKIKFFFTSLGSKFAYSEHYLFQKLFPKTFAASVTQSTSYVQDDYVLTSVSLQFCTGNPVLNPYGEQDMLKEECDGSGNNCQTRMKCQKNGNNCCDSSKLNLDGISCDPNWRFKQKYKKCTTVKTKTTCEKDEEGKKVDPNCKEEWVPETTCEDNLDSCSTYTSAANTTIECSKTNSEKTRMVGQILTAETINDLLYDSDSDSGHGSTLSCPLSTSDKEDYVRDLFGAPTCFISYSNGQEYESTPEDFSSIIRDVEAGLSGESFCTTYIGRHCTASDDSYISYAAKLSGGNCVVQKTVSSDTGSIDSEGSFTQTPVTDTCKPEYGYYNMQNIGGTYNLICDCQSAYPYVSVNNSKVCCKAPENGNETVYALTNPSNGSGACISCSTDFDSSNNRCCPENSVFNGTKCECVEGYQPDNISKPSVCNVNANSCSKGAHFDTENKVCVTNSPIVKANRFCELITDNWNIASSSCGGFSTVNNVQYNASVYNAVKGTNNVLMSIKSKKGAFANITPNVVLANGLELWILGDKAASIPGLSFNPANASASQNICRDLNKNTKEACDNQNGTFCQTENHCFTMDSVSLNKMGDARNCCASPDLGSIAHNANYEKDNRAFAVSGFTIFVDINGKNKGSSTLWDDIFPFYVGSNGKVYPGYPLDAVKKANTAENAKITSLYIGGNSTSMLPADVYYYNTDDSNKSRKKVIAYPGVSYARALCSAKIISKHAPYCMNLGEKYNDINAVNPCDSHKCFVGVRKKLRFF